MAAVSVGELPVAVTLVGQADSKRTCGRSSTERSQHGSSEADMSTSNSASGPHTRTMDGSNSEHGSSMSERGSSIGRCNSMDRRGDSKDCAAWHGDAQQ